MKRHAPWIVWLLHDTSKTIVARLNSPTLTMNIPRMAHHIDVLIILAVRGDVVSKNATMRDLQQQMTRGAEKSSTRTNLRLQKDVMPMIVSTRDETESTS